MAQLQQSRLRSYRRGAAAARTPGAPNKKGSAPPVLRRRPKNRTQPVGNPSLLQDFIVRYKSGSSEGLYCLQVSASGPIGQKINTTLLQVSTGEPRELLQLQRCGSRRSPCNRPAQVIQVLQSTLTLLRVDDIDQIRDTFVDAQACIGAAQVGPYPARRHK